MHSMTTTTALGHVIGNNAPDCRASVWILIRVLALQPVKWVFVMLLVEVAEKTSFGALQSLIGC